MKANITSK